MAIWKGLFVVLTALVTSAGGHPAGNLLSLNRGVQPVLKWPPALFPVRWTPGAAHYQVTHPRAPSPSLALGHVQSLAQLTHHCPLLPPQERIEEGTCVRIRRRGDLSVWRLQRPCWWWRETLKYVCIMPWEPEPNSENDQNPLLIVSPAKRSLLPSEDKSL